MDAIAQWWDAVELWMAQLPFPFQFALLMAVLLPSSLGAARLIDRVVDNASSRFNPPTPVDAPAEPDKVDAGSSS
ncbi:putative membrane protein [Saccharothrix espanaensis DSM 44229]|uniref:Putative membrane protein n=1 Tax=Saccharothrix espanaensis (strain ATCC 51144 / DSM 44229 / JCM 9112 / NBRC 15066 / NRRL 15764) TaxID=1179773 RepID=K0JTC3_SACES|nr:putative membrane protein [Saccharothrix espanaensis DSM 44229]